MKKNGKSDETRAGAPAWIVTFSDMITLLLTFFVMLISMADTQVDKHKFMEGRNSFRRAIADFGLSGFLISKSSRSQFEYPKPKYNIDEGNDQPKDRSLDAHTEMMRRILLDIENMMKITPSPLTAVSKIFLPTNIRFPPGNWDLDQTAQDFLRQYCEQLKVNMPTQEPTIYVLGIAGAEPSGRQQWIVSARRAQTVADFLRRRLSDQKGWSIYSWGAGQGGQWTGKTGIINKQTEILITVLNEKK